LAIRWRLLLTAAGRAFVFFDVLCQTVRLIRDVRLLLRQTFRIVAALGAAADGALPAQDAFDLLDIGLDSRLILFQAIGTVLAEQQFQNLRQIAVHVGLLGNRLAQLLAPNQVDKSDELRRDLLILAACQRLFQQRGASRVRVGMEFRHLQHQHFQALILVGQVRLTATQLVDRVVGIRRRGRGSGIASGSRLPGRFRPRRRWRLFLGLDRGAAQSQQTTETDHENNRVREKLAWHSDVRTAIAFFSLLEFAGLHDP
jgi:hypothetical protein